VRITANWPVLTRDSSATTRPAFDARDPAAYEQVRWSNLDAAVRAVRDAGMTTMIDIGFWAPHWATSAPPGPRARTNVKPRDYADFAVAVARRYSGEFVVPRAPGEPQPQPPPAQDHNRSCSSWGSCAARRHRRRRWCRPGCLSHCRSSASLRCGTSPTIPA
jgi:hypothetical protein